MFIAHIPAGYLITSAIQRKTGRRVLSLLLTGMLASTFPDIDLFYNWFYEGQHIHHHLYMTHWPMFWLFFSAGMWATLLVTGHGKHYGIYALVWFVNVWAHMAMDSVASTIYWLEPFSHMAVNLVQIPRRYEVYWQLNFFVHWTFLIEILITVTAFIVWVRRCRNPS
jgi:inner membrane protein